MAVVGEISFDQTHRLGNQLGLIPVWLNRLRKRVAYHGIVDSTIISSLKDIENQIRRVLNDSVKIKKIFGESGKVGEFRSTIPISLIIEENIRSIGVRDKITIVAHISKDCEKISLDGRVNIILNNLLTNAVEAMRLGGKIKIQVEKNIDFLKMRVSDQGGGIPKEIRGKVFNYAFSTKGSSGYGLWSSRETAKAMGGDLQIEESSTRGTVFALILPKSTAEGFHESEE